MTMHRLALKYAGVVSLAVVLWCPTSFAETITHATVGVTKIDFMLPGELSVRYGTKEVLSIEAEPSVLAKLDIRISNETLAVASKEHFQTDQPLKFNLTIQMLRRITSAGSGNVCVENFTGPGLDIYALGSGNIRLKDINENRLFIVIKGSGNIDASGRGETVIGRIDGSGTIDTTRFRAQFAHADLNGSGEILVHADSQLNAAIRGAGNIRYQGPAKVMQSISGAGTIGQF